MFNELAKITKGKNLPLTAVNENGENMIIESGKDTELGIFFRVIVFQHNGWNRINIYYEDGTFEEEYSK